MCRLEAQVLGFGAKVLRLRFQDLFGVRYKARKGGGGTAVDINVVSRPTVGGSTGSSKDVSSPYKPHAIPSYPPYQPTY